MTVVGPLKTINGFERYIYAYCVNSSGVSDILAPLGMSNAAIGGASPDPYTSAVPENAAGVYNIGLLVRTAGRVTGHAPGELEMCGFYITDGSRVIDNPSGEPGVLVDCQWADYLPEIGTYVTVTGALGAAECQGKPIRVLRPHYQSDIVEWYEDE